MPEKNWTLLEVLMWQATDASRVLLSLAAFGLLMVGTMLLRDAIKPRREKMPRWEACLIYHHAGYLATHWELHPEQDPWTWERQEMHAQEWWQ